jgi:hypothetical protein
LIPRNGPFVSRNDTSGAAVALMANIKGIGFHAMTGKVKRSEVGQSVAELEKQSIG